MPQPELLKQVIRTLESLKIDYMITGSIASSLQGEPRTTHDIDLVVSLSESVVSRLLSSFPNPPFYLDRTAVMEAIREQGMFNLIDTREDAKVDFWILKNESYALHSFRRKYIENTLGLDLKVSTPEDTILAKLKWAKQCGGSEKQFTDALHVYEVQFPRLDQTYLDLWASKLDVVEMLQSLRQQAQPI